MLYLIVFYYKQINLAKQEQHCENEDLGNISVNSDNLLF
jgi:hypothetical protein